MNYAKEIKELKARVEKLENPKKHENLEKHEKITLEEFWDSDKPLAIYCETIKQAEKLFKTFDKMGKRWINGDSYLSKKLEPEAEYCYTTEGTWSFTEDEKVILRNLPKKYKWIARDKDDILCCFDRRYKPNKYESSGVWGCANAIGLRPFSHLFQCIKWEDDEPCEFRRYL